MMHFGTFHKNCFFLRKYLFFAKNLKSIKFFENSYIFFKKYAFFFISTWARTDLVFFFFIMIFYEHIFLKNITFSWKVQQTSKSYTNVFFYCANNWIAIFFLKKTFSTVSIYLVHFVWWITSNWNNCRYIKPEAFEKINIKMKSHTFI